MELERILDYIESLRHYISQHYEEWKSLTGDWRKEILWVVYETLPRDLQSRIFSEETANINWDLAEKYNIENVSKFAEMVGDVFLGVLPPGKFQERLANDLKLDPQVASTLFQDAQELLFGPVHASLDRLYKE